MKLLSIIIPYHNEGNEIIKPLLNSINEQQDVDFNEIEIFVINNCDNPIKPSIISDNSFPQVQSRLTYLICPTKNISGMSRQFGIDNSTAEFVTFCDDDDTLYQTHSLFNMLKAIKENSLIDVIKFREIAEIWDGKQINYKVVQDNKILVHGKAYRTKFLKDNNICFSDVLEVGEDNFFNEHIIVFNPTTIFDKNIVYIFRHNPNSVSRRSGADFEKRVLHSMCYMYEYLTEKYYSKPTFMISFNSFIAGLEHYYKRSVEQNWEEEKDLLMNVCCKLFDICQISPKEYIHMINNIQMTTFVKRTFIEKRGLTVYDFI